MYVAHLKAQIGWLLGTNDTKEVELGDLERVIDWLEAVIAEMSAEEITLEDIEI